MEQLNKKPKLIFFQWNHSAAPLFIQLHMQLHVKCLAEFFDLIIINEDCDYLQVCETHKPDLALFEGGYRTSLSKKLTIKNTSSHPDIPKLGLHNGDPWCDCRAGFISDMDHWGIETFFSISTTTAEHTPEIADYLFVWPNFIDSDIYHDYKQAKIIPVLFNGSMSPLYPWRQKIHKLISKQYPALTFPHLGYESRSSMMIHGEMYARTINASWFVPACGAIAKEIVRKHFEIPGSKSCLITERSPSLEAAGFIDMQNCVFADETNVLDKLDYLFKNTRTLEAIINEGYRLVHSRHTLKQRNQIFQWYCLYKNLGINQKIIQVNPFEPLRIVERESGLTSNHILGNGLHLEYLRKGDEKLKRGRYDEAEAFYLKSLSYVSYMSEPKLRLGICSLYKGKTAEAEYWIIGPNLNNLSNYKPSDPDPIEWAYLIISLLCKGKLGQAALRADQFPTLNHTELVRTRWAVGLLHNKANLISCPSHPESKERYTIHQLPPLSFNDWVLNLCKMLRACQQIRYADELSSHVATTDEAMSKRPYTIVGAVDSLHKSLISLRIKWLAGLSYTFRALHIPNHHSALPPALEIDYFIRLMKWAKLGQLKKIYISLIRKYKYYSMPSEEEFHLRVQELVQNVKIHSILRIGASTRSTGERAILTSINEDQANSSVFDIKIGRNSYTERGSISDKECAIKYVNLICTKSDPSLSQITACVKHIKENHGIKRFDMVLLDEISQTICEQITGLVEPEFIILVGANFTTFKLRHALVENSNYIVMDENPAASTLYVILKKDDNKSFDEDYRIAKHKATCSTDLSINTPLLKSS
ncbi:glycosyltransferase [Pontibacter sp. HSC-36F09]|uniref:glycosyltransferase n=1 Tax=Pontibacter sp. HSC-36F09 TaxID=2910966 RepID=UPI00209E5A13|nr:glycosyltransferase [Pontibacter sp. HSC-36F09]MCP2045730.1 tetratricopeptide (TPR) repeat protein [Pontibacter sp. HSC-36F09]